MTDGPLRVQVPAACPQCKRPGTVTVERTIKSEEVTLSWCCTACSHAWPISADEVIRRHRG